MDGEKNQLEKELINKEDCTGCSACMNICVQKAISMKYSKDGFLYPAIDTNKCIDCKTCLLVCPLIKKNKIARGKKEVLETLVGFSKNRDLVFEGSSGGIFPTLAKAIIEEKGVVFGSVFNAKEKEIQMACSNEVELTKIFKSKYVQSRVGNNFFKIKTMLEEGKIVLFCGTPCQVAGLNSFLNSEYDNLITIDFICHGVPAPLVFKEILEEIESKEKASIIDCSFREKDNGWRNQTLKFYFKNGNIKKISSKWSIYYNLFIYNFILRKSCYECDMYKNYDSDITLGDAWECDINKDGVSKIYINSLKGKKFIKKYYSSIYFETAEKEDIKKYAHNYSINNRNWFYKYYDTHKKNKMLFLMSGFKCIFIRIKNKIRSKL